MPVTLSWIERTLNDHGHTCAVCERREYVVARHGPWSIYVRVLEDGAAVTVRMPGLFMLPEGEHREKALSWMLHESYRLKVSNWVYDPSDGEVALDHFIAVEDGDLTPRQLLRAVRGIGRVASQNLPELIAVAHGREPLDRPPPRRSPGQEPNASLSSDLEALLAGSETSPPPAESLPDPPVNERIWVALLPAAFGLPVLAFPGERYDTERLIPLRSLRDASIQAGEHYISAEARQEWDLTEEAENVMLLMLAQHITGDNQTTLNEVQAVAGTPSDGEGRDDVPPGLQALLDRGLAAALGGTNQPPYRLSETVLTRLGDAASPLRRPGGSA